MIISGDHDLIPLKHTVKINKNISKYYFWILPKSGKEL